MNVDVIQMVPSPKLQERLPTAQSNKKSGRPYGSKG